MQTVPLHCSAESIWCICVVCTHSDSVCVPVGRWVDLAIAKASPYCVLRHEQPMPHHPATMHDQCTSDTATAEHAAYTQHSHQHPHASTQPLAYRSSAHSNTLRTTRNMWRVQPAACGGWVGACGGERGAAAAPAPCIMGGAEGGNPWLGGRGVGRAWAGGGRVWCAWAAFVAVAGCASHTPVGGCPSTQWRGTRSA